MALPTSKNVPFTRAASRIFMIGSVADRFGPSSNVERDLVRTSAGAVRDAAAEPVRARSLRAHVRREADHREEQHGGRDPAAAAARRVVAAAGHREAHARAEEHREDRGAGPVGALGEEPGRDQCGEPAGDARRRRPARESRDRRSDRPARPLRARGRRALRVSGRAATAPRNAQTEDRAGDSRERHRQRAEVQSPGGSHSWARCGRVLATRASLWSGPFRRSGRAESAFSGKLERWQELIGFASVCSRR